MLRHRVSFKLGIALLGLMSLIALTAPLISNNVPYFLSLQGESYFPLWEKLKGEHSIQLKIDGKQMERSLIYDDWRFMGAERMIWPLIPYTADVADPFNRMRVSPGGAQKDDLGGSLKSRYRHILGTDQVGRDIASGLIYGTRISLGIAFFSMLIAGLIGLLLGGLAGFFGDHGLRINLGHRLGLLAAIALIIYYGFVLPTYMSEEPNKLAIIFISMVVLVGIPLLFGLAPGVFRRRRALKIDHWLSRLIEWFTSLPKLILILSIAAVMEGSYLLVLLVIGFTSWTFIARIARAEMLRVREVPFVQSANALGYNRFRIFVRHALPNVMNPIVVSLAFGAGSAIIIESSLSFLGIGVPADTVSWGAMIAQGRSHIESWWLVLFPGVMIFFSVLSFQLIGEGLSQRTTHKLPKEL